MEMMFLIGFLIVLGIPILAIVAIVMASRALKNTNLLVKKISDFKFRLNNLESELLRRTRDITGEPAGTKVDEATGEEGVGFKEPGRVKTPEILEPPPATQPSEPSAPLPTYPPVQPSSGAQDPDTTAPAGAPAASPPPSLKRLEEQFGSRIFVWIGSIALGLAGIFLVKYTFDRNLLTPIIRVALGLGFGVALLAAGQWMWKKAEGVAQGLSGAGIVVLYATLLAGVNLYDLIPRTVGFGLMALTTAVAVILSIQQGPWIALLGLLGGFLTPALIGSEEPRPGSLFSYLFLVQAGLITVSRRRRWVPIFGLVILGGMAWVGLWMGMEYQTGHGIWLGLFVLASVAAFLYGLRPGVDWGKKDEAQAVNFLRWASVILGLIMLGSLVGVGGFSTQEWIFLGILGAGCLVLARFDSQYTFLPYMASAAGMIVLMVWSLGPDSPDPTRFGLTALAFGLLYAGAAYAFLWRAARPDHWAILSIGSAIGYLLVAYFEIDPLPLFLNWGVICLVLAVVYLAAAFPVARRRARMPAGEPTLAVMALGITSLVSLAVPMELERAWITVAWAVQVAAIAWIHTRLRVRSLPAVAGILAALVAVRLLLNPAVLTYEIGAAFLWNWLLYGYGVPLIAFAAAAYLFRRTGPAKLVEALEGGAILFGLALMTLETRHYFHPGDLTEDWFALAEWGTLSIVWLLYALGLMAAARRLHRRPLIWGGWAIATLGLGQAILAQGINENPLLWSSHPVGSMPILNSLLYVYGIPAVLALLIARALTRQKKTRGALAAGVVSLFLFFMLVTLEVRQLFHGSDLHAGNTSNAEWYSYSFAWILFGTLLLILGIRARSQVLRYASLVVMLVAVAKVFLFDTAHLTDLYRVFSFLGLGLSLLFLAYLYQRFLFREPNQ